MSIQSVAIIGAGVAGLAAALSLARHGIRSDIIEQAPQLAEVGAGLQMSPNATRILDTLGVLKDIESRWVEPDAIRLTCGRSLRPLAAVPAGQFARDRWGAPYGVLHRATLQQALLHGVLNSPLCKLHLGQRMTEVSDERIQDMTGALPDLIIGADGVWSQCRSRVPGSPTSEFSGNIAWRFTLKTEAAPDFLDKNSVTAFLGPGCHMVCYPLREVGGFNIVAIAAGVSPGETWAASGSASQHKMLIDQFGRWNKRITALLDTVQDANFWPLFKAGPGNWQNGRDTALIGDAAHAMMPFAAQGAAMAIEDAFVLAGHVARSPLPQALAKFESERKARAKKVGDRGAFNKFAYHARGPFRIGRDMVLALRRPESLAADLDWLYGYRTEG